ncbi:MAG TPA: CopD family protein [Pseudolabrys sp.]
MQALAEGVDWTLLTQTQFGAAWKLRAVAAVLFVISLALAIVSVLILLLTGIVNTYVLVGSLSGPAGTLYGELLLTKLGLFLFMLGFAAVNRLGLTPCLSRAPSAGVEQRRHTVDLLARNSIFEFALSLAVLTIVSVLGTLPPPSHSHPSPPGEHMGDHALHAE